MAKALYQIEKAVLPRWDIYWNQKNTEGFLHRMRVVVELYNPDGKRVEAKSVWYDLKTTETMTNIPQQLEYLASKEFYDKMIDIAQEHKFEYAGYDYKKEFIAKMKVQK